MHRTAAETTWAGDKGIYTLLLRVYASLELNIGGLGRIRLHPGIYAYTGSAQGSGGASLPARLTRHLRLRKPVFWHIDYLLSNPVVTVEVMIYALTCQPLECSVNRAIRTAGRSRIVAGFGASDCAEGCKGHLTYLPRIELADAIKRIVEAYADLRLHPRSVKAPCAPRSSPALPGVHFV